jgi:hypothetical protein
MKMTGKIKLHLYLQVAMMFASKCKKTTNKATNYDQGFRLGVGANAGYSLMILTNYHLVQM